MFCGAKKGAGMLAVRVIQGENKQSGCTVSLWDKLMGISKNLVGFLEMPDEFFISLYILMTYEKHRKLNLRKSSKN